MAGGQGSRVYRVTIQQNFLNTDTNPNTCLISKEKRTARFLFKGFQTLTQLSRFVSPSL